MKIKREHIFNRLGLIDDDRSELGRQQFFDHQSQGVVPGRPDPYYMRLSSGKSQLDFLVENWRDMRYTDEWPGWYQIYADFWHDVELFWLIFPTHRYTLI